MLQKTGAILLQLLYSLIVCIFKFARIVIVTIVIVTTTKRQNF